MPPGFQDWIKKMQSLFFGNESIIDEKQNVPRTQKQFGRLENDERKIQSKIIHQYPQSGKFRFPVPVDLPTEQQKHSTKKVVREVAKDSVNTMPRQTRAAYRQSKQEQESKKGSKKPFKPTHIPSPVYGFKERSADKLYYSTKEQEIEARFKEEYEQSINNIEKEPAAFLVDEITEDWNEEIPYEEERKLLHSPGAVVEQQAAAVMEHSLALPLAQDEAVEKKVFPPPSSEQGQQEKGHTVYPDDENSYENVGKEIDKGTEEEGHSHTQPENPSIPEKEAGQAQVQYDEDAPKKVSTQIPYNVMMLPKDRKLYQERKENGGNEYPFPGIHLLNIAEKHEEDDRQWLNEQAYLLEETLENFNVKAKVIDVTKGPSVTRFEIQPAPGVKVSKVTSLTDDIKLCLAAKDIRIEAPIPGKHAIGIEVPNKVSSPVFLREIIRQGVFTQSSSPLTVALGLDISGQAIVTDLKKMPHGLVAGATGSGKSVCINSILISLLYKANPDEVKLMLIDPKMVELAPYNELPHLLTPVITDAKQATAALKWVVLEMERRYELFSTRGARDLGRYNELYSEDRRKPALPYIVVIIDELADLMMVAPQDVEESICRIAQKARACGIHLLLATQRPSVDVITGLIKSNIPTRIAFSVSSQVDSRTIIDMSGAERLLGKGDMLFHENGAPKPVRVQGTFVSDDEIEKVLSFVKKQRKPEYIIETDQLSRSHDGGEQEDELFEEACYFVLEQDGASASALQRRFRIGYNRAARLVDMMEAKGIISEAMGSKPRNILMSVSEFENTILHYSGEENKV